MGVKGFEDQSPVPETYAGPQAWWDPSEAKSATIIDRDMSTEEALTMGGLDWPVELREFTYPGESGPVTVPNWRGVIRPTDDAFLGMVTPTYRTFQNEELAALGDHILAQGGCHWHTVGSLYGGKIVWMQAKFDHTMHIHGDGSPIEDYLTLWTGHDGRHAANAANMPNRVWCGNTLAQGIANARQSITLRHTKGMDERLEEVRAALDIHYKYWETLEQVLNGLAQRPMTLKEVGAYTVALLPADPDIDKPYRTEAQRDEIMALYRDSDNLRNVPKTAYRAYNATVEWLDHTRVIRDTKVAAAGDRRALSILEGGIFDTKSRALALLLKA